MNVPSSRAVPVVVSALVLMSATCVSSSGTWWNRKSTPHDTNNTTVSDGFMFAGDRTTGSAVTRTPVTVVDLTFDVMKVSLPIGSIRHSRKIWNHVNELRVDPEIVANLARNGLRIGVTTTESWPAISTILSACNASVAREQIQAFAGLPLSIELGTISSGESIFSYDRGLRLAGKTFFRGKKLMNIGYAVHNELGGYVEVELSFEIRHDRGVMTWERQADSLKEVPAFERYAFNGLTTTLPVSPDGFLVVGPSEETTKDFLIGSRFFLTDQPHGQSETLYFLTPVLSKSFVNRHAGR